jgi:hypothetical protein
MSGTALNASAVADARTIESDNQAAPGAIDISNVGLCRIHGPKYDSHLSISLAPIPAKCLGDGILPNKNRRKADDAYRLAVNAVEM